MQSLNPTLSFDPFVECYLKQPRDHIQQWSHSCFMLAISFFHRGYLIHLNLIQNRCAMFMLATMLFEETYQFH